MTVDIGAAASLAPDKTVRRWMSMVEAAYQCRDDIRDSSGNTPRHYELQFVAEEMRAVLAASPSPPQEGADAARHIQTLTLMGNAMAHKLKKADPTSGWPAKWGGYVTEHRLSSPLRAQDATA